jgi:hypothetical protein
MVNRMVNVKMVANGRDTELIDVFHEIVMEDSSDLGADE